MNQHDERIFFCGIVVFGQQEPALHIEAVRLPAQRLGFAPGGLDAVVEVREPGEGVQRERVWTVPGIEGFDRVNFYGVIKARCAEYEEGVIGSGGKRVREAAVAGGGPKIENRRIKDRWPGGGN